MQLTPSVSLGDRVVTNRIIADPYLPIGEYGVVVGFRDACIPKVLYVDFDNLVLHGIRRSVVFEYEVNRIQPTGLEPSSWEACGWNPTGETHG